MIFHQVEEYHYDWNSGMAPNLSIHELYELYLDYQNSSQSDNNSTSNLHSTPEVVHILNQGEFSIRVITFENELTFTWR